MRMQLGLLVMVKKFVYFMINGLGTGGIYNQDNLVFLILSCMYYLLHSKTKAWNEDLCDLF